MFTVQIAGHGGVEAEFVVPCPVLALDLALRAGRAGIAWRAAAGEPAGRPLSLWDLRELAQRQASTEPARAVYLAEVMRAESRAAAAALN